MLYFLADHEINLTKVSEVILDGPGSYPTPGGDTWLVIREDSQTGSLPSEDYILVSATKFPFPWTVRTWKKGDYIRPWGMSGKRKKLQDVFIDQKVPRNEKAQIWFLCAHHEILWVPGLKKSELLREQMINEKDRWLVILDRKKKGKEI